MINELIDTMKACGSVLNRNIYEGLKDKEIIALCIEVETMLFRARIKTERTINQ